MSPVMQPNFVLASASSRLHADLIVIRLRRAGISREKISAVFPERLKPNCALCWLDGASEPAKFGADSVVVAGPLRKRFNLESETSFARSLQQLGVGRQDAAASAEHLGRGEILVCIHTQDQEQIAIAWHLFREMEAEGIALGISREKPERRGWLKRLRSRARVNGSEAGITGVPAPA